jgi:putative transposase
VLTANHVHLLITPRDRQGPSKTMQTIGRWFVRRINERHGRTGTLWEGRYKSMIVDSESYVLACSRYVELNPVRAGMVLNPADYPWSSYPRNAWGVPDDLITESRAYEGLGRQPVDRQAAYRALCDTQLDDQTLDTIRRATQRGTGVVHTLFKRAEQTMDRATRTQGGDRRSERFRRNSIRFQRL